MRGALVAIVVLLGCGENAGDGSDSDAAQSGDTQSFTCNAGDVDFPEVDKTCTTASDCTFLTHVIDCCGNTIVVGVNAADSAGIGAFDTAETECSALFPGCGCPSGPSEAEDGNTGTPSMISVDCSDNLCHTFIAGL